MERCFEEISSTVLDAGDVISYRTLSIRTQVSVNISVQALTQFSAENSNVKALQVLVKRSTVEIDDKSETAVAKNDPRSRILCLAIGNQDKKDDVLCQQIYALYNEPNAATEDDDEIKAVATACWAQECHARNDVFDSLKTHVPLSAAVKALYTSGIKCVEATARQEFGEEEGEEIVSTFDGINASIKKKLSSSGSSMSFFDSSNNTSVSKARSLNRNKESKMITGCRKEEATRPDMSDVLTVDSDDDEEEETDVPVLVKKTKRIISDDDDDEEDEALPLKETRTPAPKSRNVKRKLNASPDDTMNVQQVEKSDEEISRNKKQRTELDDEVDEDDDVKKPVLDTKRRVLVTKTRINEQGYMVTEKTYEEVELTSEEIEKEQKAVKKKMEAKKIAEKAVKAKKETKKQNGPPKQRDLRSFFSFK